MKKYAALLLACALLCAALPAAQAEVLYGMQGGYGVPAGYGAADLTAGYGLSDFSAGYGAADMTAAYGLPAAAGGMTGSSLSYGMAGASAAYGMTGTSVSVGAVSAPAAYGACAPASPFQAFKGFVNGYRINVRSCPGTSGTVCGVVSYGDPIYVTNYTYVSSKLWYYGSIGSLCGWIFSGYVGGAPTFSPTPVMGCTVPDGYGTICMNATNFRTGPGMCYASLMQLKKGTRVQLLCAVTDVSGVIWYQVLTSGCTGWVRSDLVTVIGYGSYGVPAPYTNTASFTGYTNMNAVNVRVSPNGTVITQVNRGTTVYVYGIVCQGGVYWYQVRFYGGVGYIRADLVSVGSWAAPGVGQAGSGSGISYYDYSDNSTTIINQGAVSGQAYGGVPGAGMNGGSPAYGNAGGSYDYSGSGSGYAQDMPYGYPDTGDYGYQPAAAPAAASQPVPSLAFTTCALSAGQTLPVYSAPNAASLRADSGTAQVTLTESLYAAGFDGQWLLVMYRNQDQMTRVGYVNAFQMQGTLPNMASIEFGRDKVLVGYRTAVTSDPMEQTDALVMLNSGDSVTLLATLSMNGQWAYVETIYNGIPVRGFVPASAVGQMNRGSVGGMGEEG